MFTREFLANKMLQIALSMPENVNPMFKNNCLYTGRLDNTKHCFMGQLLLELDLPVPGPDRVAGISTVIGNSSVYEPLKPFARQLNVIQATADANGSPINWGSEDMLEIISLFEKDELGDYGA